MDQIKEIIDRWDPLELLSHAPDDEYHSEIAEIEDLLKQGKDFRFLAEGIYGIFARSFGEENFTKSRHECEEIAREIMSAKNG